MKLQQLRYLIAIARNGLNISAAVESLYTSQPGVSKQLKLLEQELGILLFNRNGKPLTHIAPAGRQIIARVESILGEVGSIKALAAEFRDEHRGNLSIATEAMALFEDLVMLPCYRWNRCVVVAAGHPLAKVERLDLDATSALSKPSSNNCCASAITGGVNTAGPRRVRGP